MLSIKRLLTNGWLVLATGLLVGLVVNSAHAQTITQGYGSDAVLQRGMLVMLKPNDGSKVQVATPEAQDKVHGVVVNANDSPVTLSTEGQKVFVATQGRFEVLVSDENGDIKVGDYLVVSNLHGIAMKADNRQKIAVAKALTGFEGKRESLGSQQANGKTINIGRINADIAVGNNPLATPEKTSVPKILQTASEFVAGRTVSAPRMYASGLVLLLTMIVSGGMFYTGTRSGITAIGRNPLSKRDIARGLLQVTLTSLIVFIIGLFAVYLLLKI